MSVTKPSAHTGSIEAAPSNTTAAPTIASRASPNVSPRLGPPVVSAQQQPNNSSDILPKALLTLGVAGAAAALGLIGYLIRKRLGFWPHRPQPDDGAPPEEHH